MGDSAAGDSAAGAQPQVQLQPQPQLLDSGSARAAALARALASAAAERSVQRDRDGPFARLAKDADVLWTKGGRPDDVCVVVALVLGEADAEAASRPLADGGEVGTGAAASGATAPSPTRADASGAHSASSAQLLLATPQCGQDATLRVLPELRRMAAAAAARAAKPDGRASRGTGLSTGKQRLPWARVPTKA